MKKKPDFKKEDSFSVPAGNNESNLQSSENDLDELVHINDTPDIEELAEQDPDEAVHQSFPDNPDLSDELDVDDLLHSRDTEDEGQ